MYCYTHSYLCGSVKTVLLFFFSISNSRYFSDLYNKTKLLQYNIDNKKVTQQSMIMFGVEIIIRWCFFSTTSCLGKIFLIQ